MAAHRRDGERGLAADTVEVVPEDDEEFRDRAGRDGVQRRQVRRPSLHQALEVGVVFVDPGVEMRHRRARVRSAFSAAAVGEVSSPG